MEDAPSFLTIPGQNVQMFGHVHHDTSGQQHGPVWKTQSFLLSKICTLILWQGLIWDRQFEKVLVEHSWRKSSKLECLFVNREKGLSLSVYVDDIKLAGKKQNIDPMLIVLVKDVDLGEPTSCHDHVYLGYTQRDSQTSKGIVDNNRNMFESEISAGAQELLRYSEKLCANISSWSYDMEGHAGKCTNSRKNKWDLTEKCLYLARIGRSDFFMVLEQLLLVLSLTTACDKRLPRSISYIHHTCEFKQYCHFGKYRTTMQIGTVPRL